MTFVRRLKPGSQLHLRTYVVSRLKTDKLCFVYTMCLRIPYDSDNKHLTLPYTILINRLIKLWGNTITTPQL
jgi:hypothetical protein